MESKRGNAGQGREDRERDARKGGMVTDVAGQEFSEFETGHRDTQVWKTVARGGHQVQGSAATQR